MIIDFQKDYGLLNSLYQEFNSQKPTYQKAYDYYCGKSDVMVNYPTTDRSNNKIKDNITKAFVEEEVAYSVGNPVTYVNNGAEKEVVKDIDFFLSNINSTLDIELDTTMKVFGRAYEMHYLNEGEFKAKVCGPLDGIAYINTEGKVELFLYFYKKMLDDTVYVDVIDDKFIYKTDENFCTIIEAIPHYFGKCPVSVAKLTNDVEDTIYYTIKELQDAHETVLSTWGNEIEDTRLAYLWISGTSLEEEEAKRMKEMGILQTQDPNGKIGYLIKNIPSDFIKTFRDILEKEMYKVTNHLDNQTQVQSNTSGTMLATRLNCLRIKITVQQRCLKEAIKKRIQDLFTYLNIAYSKNYNYKDIDIQFTLNLPSNDLEMSQIISQLNGKLSIKTGLSQLSFVTNADEEYQKMLDEQKDLMGDDLDDLSDEGDIEDIQDKAVEVTEDVASKSLNGAQTQSLINIIEQYSQQVISFGQAINLISISIGISKEEAKKIIEGAE